MSLFGIANKNCIGSDKDTLEIQVTDLPNRGLSVNELVNCKKLVLGTDKLPADEQVLIVSCPNLERADI